MHWRRKWQPTPVFLPGEFRGRGSLVGCRLCGRTESDTTEATQQQQQRKQVIVFVITVPADHIQKAKENTKTQNKALKLKAPPLEGFLGKIGIPRDLDFALLSYSPCQGQGSSTRKHFSVQPHQQGGSGESCTGVRSLRFLAWICKKCNYHSQQENSGNPSVELLKVAGVTGLFLRDLRCGYEARVLWQA